MFPPNVVDEVLQHCDAFALAALRLTNRHFYRCVHRRYSDQWWLARDVTARTRQSILRHGVITEWYEAIYGNWCSCRNALVDEGDAILCHIRTGVVRRLRATIPQLRRPPRPVPQDWWIYGVCVRLALTY